MQLLNSKALIAFLTLTLLLLSCGNAEQQAEEQRRSEEAKQERQRDAYKTAISTFLKQDSAMALAANGNHTAYAASMRKLDLSQCPNDFAASYVDHIHAWEDAAQIQEAQKQLNSDPNMQLAVIETLLQKISGSDKNAITDHMQAEQELNDAAERASAKIRKTFQEVERIAVSYGARLPVQ